VSVPFSVVFYLNFVKLSQIYREYYNFLFLSVFMLVQLITKWHNALRAGTISHIQLQLSDPSKRMVSVLPSKFKVTINKAWCKGCELCVAVCPKNVLELDENLKSEPVRMEDCIGCRQCENICPDLAITIGKGDQE